MSVLSYLSAPGEFITWPYNLKLVRRARMWKCFSKAEGSHERFETSRTKLSIYNPQFSSRKVHCCADLHLREHTGRPVNFMEFCPVIIQLSPLSLSLSTNMKLPVLCWKQESLHHRSNSSWSPLYYFLNTFLNHSLILKIRIIFLHFT